MAQLFGMAQYRSCHRFSVMAKDALLHHISRCRLFWNGKESCFAKHERFEHLRCAGAVTPRVWQHAYSVSTTLCWSSNKSVSLTHRHVGSRQELTRHFCLINLFPTITRVNVDVPNKPWPWPFLFDSWWMRMDHGEPFEAAAKPVGASLGPYAGFLFYSGGFVTPHRKFYCICNVFDVQKIRMVLIEPHRSLRMEAATWSSHGKCFTITLCNQLMLPLKWQVKEHYILCPFCILLSNIYIPDHPLYIKGLSFYQ